MRKGINNGVLINGANSMKTYAVARLPYSTYVHSGLKGKVIAVIGDKIFFLKETTASTDTEGATNLVNLSSGTLTNVNTDKNALALNYASGTWDATYDGSVLPASASPAWTKTGTGTESVSSGVLKLSGTSYVYYSRSSILTAGNTTVFEARLKTVSGNQHFVSLMDGAKSVRVFFDTTQIRIDSANGGATYACDLTKFNVVRVTKIGQSSWKVDLNGETVLTGTTFGTTSTNAIQWGDTGSSSYEYYIDYVTYKLNGEPAYATSGNRVSEGIDLSSVGVANTTKVEWEKVDGVAYTDLVPTMTSNTTPSGVASCSSTYSETTYPAWHVFDKATGLSNLWQSADNANTNQWIQYIFPTSQTLKRVKVIAYQSYHPKNYKVQAYVNSVWVDIATGSLPNGTVETSYTIDFLSNSIASTTWRFFIVDCWNSAGVVLNELYFYSETTYSSTIEISTNNGVDYQAVTNGGLIPQLPSGTDLTGKTLKVKETLTGNGAVTPLLKNLKVKINID